MSINISIFTLLSINYFLPGQIYFTVILIAQIGELISCPLYVIIYCFNQQRFRELKRILLCDIKIRSSDFINDSDVNIDLFSDTDSQ